MAFWFGTCHAISAIITFEAKIEFTCKLVSKFCFANNPALCCFYHAKDCLPFKNLAGALRESPQTSTSLGPFFAKTFDLENCLGRPILASSSYFVEANFQRKALT